MRDAYASATFAREATFFHFCDAAARGLGKEKNVISLFFGHDIISLFFGHDIDEATDKSHTQHLIQNISYWWKGNFERRIWNIVPIDAQDAG